MKKTEIKKEVSCLRCHYIDGKEITKIVFYENGKEIITNQQGWLELGNLTDSESIMIYEVKKAIKLNLNRKDNFYIKDKKHYKDGYILYINLNQFEYFNVTKKEWLKTKEYTNYRNFVSFKLKEGCYITYKEYVRDENGKAIKQANGSYLRELKKTDVFNDFMDFVNGTQYTEYGLNKKSTQEKLKEVLKLDYLYFSDEIFENFKKTFLESEDQ